jgi:GNAT superfamily N-acetyltransferase
MCEEADPVPAGALTYRWMTEAELSRLADIDRAETVRVGYEQHGARLVELAVDWDDPGFFKEGDGEHSVAHQVAFCRRHLAAGARMIGAFDGETLVGVGVLTPEVRPRTAQLAYLHVSAAYRRRGVAGSLFGRLLSWAREQGAETVYVSATPSQSAVSFYRRQGFEPINDPLPELYALEPEDIQMRLLLDSSGATGRPGARLDAGSARPDAHP